MTAAGFEALVSAALLGTARTAPSFDGLHTEDAADAVAGEPEHRLLAAAALESVYLAGAFVPIAHPLGPAAPDDPRPVLPAAAHEQLRALVVERSPLLDEWLVAAARFKAPPESIPALLDHALASPGDRRDALLALVGPRGLWVARRHPRWGALVHTTTSDDPWLHGSPTARRDWFRALRSSDPAAAAARLSEVWSSEPASRRQALLDELDRGLGAHDHDLLETALDDRSVKVRDCAIRLLRRLPHSAFGARMARRVGEWSRIERGVLVVEIPDPLDRAAIRDGLDRPIDAPRRSPAEHRSPAEQRLWALAVSAPLDSWDTAGIGPEGVLSLEITEPSRTILRTAWSTATAVRGDGAWAQALLRHDAAFDDAVYTALPRPVLLEHLREADEKALLDEPLLRALAGPWPADLAERVLSALYTAVAPRSALFRSLTDLLAYRAPFELADLLADAATRTDDLERLNRFATTADILIRRRTIHEELS